MTWTAVAGALLWGGCAAGGFLWWLQREVLCLSERGGRGHFPRAALRVLVTAFALVLVGMVNGGLIPLALVGFTVTRYAWLWRIGGSDGH